MADRGAGFTLDECNPPLDERSCASLASACCCAKATSFARLEGVRGPTLDAELQHGVAGIARLVDMVGRWGTDVSRNLE